MVQAIIFDYFGVIRPDALRATYARLGGDVVADERFITDTLQALNHGFIASSRPVFAQRLGVREDEWSAALDAASGNDERLLTYIRQLRSTYKTGILSNIGPNGFSRLFAPGELDQYFDSALSSGDAGMAKPDPRIFVHMAERLGVAPEACVMVDDSADNCAGARTAGMQTVCYVSFEQGTAELESLLKAGR